MSLTQINKAGLDEIALDHVFTIGASGSSAYTFQGEGLNGTVNNPTLYLTRGKTYRFENGTGGHPIRIQSTSGASGTQYNTGVTNNATAGTVIVEVQHDAPDVLYYQCTSHAAMNGILYITGALADGGVTTAKIAGSAVTTAKIADSNVTTAKIADDAVTAAKLADNAVVRANISDDAVNADKITAGGVDTTALGSDSVTTVKILNANVTTDKLADNAVTSQKIANDAVTLSKLENGTSSNDGKFLRANNGADPSFETVTSTTINGNTDHQVMTGTGTANTLQGESTFTHNPSTYDTKIVHNANSPADLIIQNDSSGTAANARLTIQSGSNANAGAILEFVTGSHSWSFITPASSGDLQINNNGTLDFVMADDGDFHVVDGDLVFSTSGHGIDFSATSDASGATNELLDDYEEGTWTPSPHDGTVSGQNCKYTKIGNTVHCWGLLYDFSDRSTNDQIKIGGLPFPPTNNHVAGVGMCSYSNDSHANHAYVNTNSQITFYGSNSGAYLQYRHNEINNNAAQIHVTVTYHTNA